MHVLPLPFGLALAFMTRREAERIQKPKPAVPHRHGLTKATTSQELRYAELQRFV